VRDIVALNAGTALYAAGMVQSIGNGLEKAKQTIASGAARAKLDQFVRTTQKLGAPAP
jgi:anthranilate phosphoribosyltransferase